MIACRACDNPTTSEFSRSPRLVLWQCPECQSLSAEHVHMTTGLTPWTSQGVDAVFLEALAQRRDIQAQRLYSVFAERLKRGPIVDYGCGQGRFARYLIEQKLNVYGADISYEGSACLIPPSQRITLKQAWSTDSLPAAATVSLLDVIEHHPQPGRFLQEFKSRGFTSFLIKVPLLDGPLASAAKQASRMGRGALLEQLFLVGDMAPHEVYFTHRGFQAMAKRQGFRIVSQVKLAEVGRELSKRVRRSSTLFNVLKLPLSAGGLALEWVAPLWSDTGAYWIEA